MKYNAHKIDDNNTQSIEEHLEEVSTLAEKFSMEIFKSLCYTVGNAHDIGKYAKSFQARLNGSRVKYEHSICGALEYQKIMTTNEDKLILPMIEFCIACHHTGLQDGDRLQERFINADYHSSSKDYSHYKDYVTLEKPNYQEIFKEIISAKNPEECIELYSFFTRYIFSCLTDADFLDTEMFYNPNIDRNLKVDFQAMYQRLEKKFNSFKNDTPLKLARSNLQNQAFENSQSDSSINILNMPTGSGKTLCSLKIALNKILNKDKKRIIYVIPYTSIIEQTANLFEDMFKEYIDILQHHSNYTYDTQERKNDVIEPSTEEKLKLACENWDAPIVITTSVQFFQSLYHYKSSRLRKLHNLADSIIIFDEIHMLPIEYLQPCLRAIGYITKYLNSEAIFLSATMPNYDELFNRYLPNSNITELITNKSDFKYFQKCEYINLGKTNYENIVLKAEEYKSSLIILNTRKSVREVYSKLDGNVYHLSTYMTPHDRSETIKKIKQDLTDNKKITVVSTSLVEAGVDLDFEAVFREMSGIDSILQSGGRCNRDGLKDMGYVYIFETDTKPSKDLQAKVEITKRLLKNYDNITSMECIEDYYSSLFGFKDNSIQSNSMFKFCQQEFLYPNNIKFQSYAENFKFIKDDTIAVVINNNDECNQLIEKLLNRDYSVKRKLQKYSVNLSIYKFIETLQLNLITDTKMGVFILSNNDYYSTDKGLDLDMFNDDIIC